MENNGWIKFRDKFPRGDTNIYVWEPGDDIERIAIWRYKSFTQADIDSLGNETKWKYCDLELPKEEEEKCPKYQEEELSKSIETIKKQNASYNYGTSAVIESIIEALTLIKKKIYNENA